MPNIFLVAALFYGFTLAVAENLANRYLRRYYPDAYIIHWIILMIVRLENSSYFWMEISSRKRLIYDIEKVASCIEKDLFKNFKSGDNTADHSLETISLRIATAFREKKLWVFTPKTDTRDHLIKNFANSLANLLVGDWDALEQKEPIKMSVKQTWLDFIKNVFRIILVGGTPILVLFLVQSTPLALVAPFKDYAIGITVLWVLFTVVTTFDPLFSNKRSNKFRTVDEEESMIPSAQQCVQQLS